MKKFLFIAIFSVVGCNMGLNAQIELRTPTQENKTILKNPTENKEFNTNAVPFDEKVQDGPRMDLNKFGVEQRRNLNIKQGEYNHYNQQANPNQTSIINGVDRTIVNRPQSTLNNNQFNYNQNEGRKVTNGASSNVTYNAPMQINQTKNTGATQTTEQNDNIIATGDIQNISIGTDGSTTTPTPTAPGGDPTPIGDALPILMLFAAIYTFIIRRKQ